MSGTGAGRDPRGGDDVHAHGAGAYVLGALSPAEDARFEEHLRSCAHCRREVDELSGLPRLLARVPEDVAADLADGAGAPRGEEDLPGADPLPDPPAGMLDALVHRTAGLRRRRRRRAGSVAAVLVAAAAVLVALVVLLGPGLPGPGGGPAAPPPTATGPAARVEVPLAALSPGPLAVDARLDPVAWGTRIRLTCRYAAAAGNAYAAPSYALVVRSPSGDREQVATWQAVPGRTVHVEAATALPLARIAAVEVRAGGGAGPAVLRGRL